ncbi:serine hydrolase [Streptomyces sp. SAI-041]|uniref:serine hydrolase n=1 Tax=Streptomyces sp. SAI-041 TaxID=2940548 RepID=UPI0024740085|nr:serine hydrolase [Streptomyces sp. SAI-041]MDH6554550.1 dipeptidyl aminopeptidase/acylaminoacyl peptidase/CubicO group peptidase (beta-lactamase class C family) [Streptomyces sp. SAI-041]
MTRPLGIDDLYSLALPEQPSLSPDGAHVVYVLRTADREHDRDTRVLWTVPTDSGAARRLTSGPADTAPAWSPDGDRIAFLRGGNGPAQLWLLPTAGGEPEPVTELPLGAGAPVWSPDGTAIAFTAPVDRRPPHRTEAASPPPVVVDRLDHKVDGDGLVGTVRNHLHVLDLAGQRVRQVTDGDWHAGAPDWSPDGRSLAFCAARGPAAALTLRSEAYVVDLSRPGQDAQPRLVGVSTGNAQAVTWTTEGDALLVVGRTDTELGHAGLLRVPLDGGPTVDLTRGLDRNVTPGGPAYPGALPRATDDGRTVLFCVRDRGCSHVYTVDPAGGAPRPLISGADRVVSALSVAKDTAVVVLATPDRYGEIVAVERATGQERVLTRHGALLADAKPFPAQERDFKISDGGTVHGWLLRDPERTGPAPLLLDIHGGPHNAWNGAADPVHLYHQELIARGWAVLLLNPRGSDGYGDSFFTATLGAWGTGDARDFLEPVDILVAEGIADPERLAVAGYSYGGYMTGYLTSRDDRFAAAVAGAMISDLTSMCGTSDAGHRLATTELGVSPWLDRDRYAELSPYSRVENVRTPTLILHGAADERCPVGQAEQWFNALKIQGVPTCLVLYPGGSHLFLLDGPPSHRTDLARRIVDWVDHHAGKSTPASSAPSAARPVDVAHWQRRLTELAERHQVPGAVLGIARGAHSDVAAYGVLNKATGVTTTRDSLFQIGSITKVWTATLAMQLVDAGTLDLDAPIADVLPELRLADPQVAQQVTMRHLLTHTSGIDGDVFTDTGRGDDCLERFVDQLDEAAQNHPLGATFSYCNSGFVLAGRVIEKLTGMSWDLALRELLCTPLGLEHTVTLPEEALRFRTAMGHDSEGDEPPRPVPAWSLPRSAGPAGLITATAEDVLAFARLHLTGGTAPDGTRLLSEQAARAMTEQQVELPDTLTLGDSWGLGWIRFGWDGHRLIGHDGATLGQSAFLRVLPEQDLAVTLLTNGGAAKDLYRDLFGEIFADLAGVALPEPPRPPAEPVSVDAGRHLGRYERAGTRIDIIDGADGLRLRYTTTGPLAHLVPEPVQETALVPVSDSEFLVQYAGSPSWIPVTFYALPDGARYVHHGMRATPKVS